MDKRGLRKNYFSFKEDEKLLEAIKNDRLIIFLGAGVSMLAGCESWDGLAINIIKKFPTDIYSFQEKEILKKIAYNDPKECITICYSKVKNEKSLLQKYFYNPIIDSITPQNRDKFSEIHDRIFNLNARAYVTTNIDEGLKKLQIKLV
ncbi:MAG: hypothetical protein L0Y79_00540 [Chlorobi bacterium]|nr:hypothetical protein [Chlorobiota bacterium]MCI0715736.1 hypothetical protein [Chlorobiota bacterium]